MPELSVIIPVYNVEKYLRECLDSVVNQTFKDIEIILIDDGSTDKSLDICKEYAQKDNRIKILKQQNRGAGAARNEGINIANGEYITFVDSDDYYPDLKILENLYNNAKNNNVYICGGSLSELHDDNRIITQYTDDTFKGYSFDENKIINYEDYQFDYGFHRFIYNLKFLKDNNIYFPDYKRFQDPPFFVRAMYFAQKFYALSQITYLLRFDHKKVNWTREKKKALLNGIADNLKFAKKHNLEKLYYLTCERLNQHSEAFTFQDIFNLQLYKLITSIDFTIVKKYNKHFKLSSDINPVTKFLKTIFSLKNKENHKIITILGIKIKLKRKKN